ncbi:UNVERIFIED_CONTAM: hypothetical protein GTU68_017954, partial [Idotea baltica]|nr:hypothetical protein [Idotea baltica]
VCGGQTGHAEVIQVLFDPSVISYRELLQIHFGTHDPTTLNQQGADKGTQYRSAIFAHDDLQREVAKSVVEDMQQYFSAPITTVVDDLTRFYKAEAYHQDYYRENSNQGYCRAVIDPKLKKLRKLFADKLAS